MAKCVGFTFVSNREARLLLLGSLPGVESLKQEQYYAKKQNSFWKIMGELTGAHSDMDYGARLQQLIKKRIALWDVCAAAEREGSLDSAIQSPEANDFATFFKTHKNIELIGFNGQPAEKLFRRLVLPQMPSAVVLIRREILPSTSPAHAGMRFEAKLAKWRDILAPLL